MIIRLLALIALASTVSQASPRRTTASASAASASAASVTRELASLDREHHTVEYLCDFFASKDPYDSESYLSQANFEDWVQYQSGSSLGCDDSTDTQQACNEVFDTTVADASNPTLATSVNRIDCATETTRDLLFSRMIFDIVDNCILPDSDDSYGSLCSAADPSPTAGLNQNDHPDNDAQYLGFSNADTGDDVDNCLDKDEFKLLAKFFSLGTINAETNAFAATILNQQFVALSCDNCVPGGDDTLGLACTACHLSPPCLPYTETNVALVFADLTTDVRSCFISPEDGDPDFLCQYEDNPAVVTPAPTPAGDTVTSLSECTTIFGTSNGANCLESFVYNGVNNTDCSLQDDERKWCYTEETQGIWGYCGECNIVSG